jgi:hypothetical protein
MSMAATDTAYQVSIIGGATQDFATEAEATEAAQDWSEHYSAEVIVYGVPDEFDHLRPRLAEFNNGQPVTI